MVKDNFENDLEHLTRSSPKDNYHYFVTEKKKYL